MSTWRPPWSAQGQFTLTLLPATRASNSVTARPPPGPGSSAALRAGSAGPLPCDLPADLGGWRGGCQPDSVPVKPRGPPPGSPRLTSWRATTPERTPPPGPAGYELVPALPHRSQPAAAADSGGASGYRQPASARICGHPRLRWRRADTAAAYPFDSQSRTVRAPAASPRCGLGLGARGARPASARTHEPGRIVPHEPIRLGCPRTGRRWWPG